MEEIEDAMCECAECGAEDVCEPDSICKCCGEGMMIPIDGGEY